MQLPDSFIVHSTVQEALKKETPIVALESAVITHGLPRPTNLELARQMEEVIRSEGAVPATIAVLDGKIHIGLSADELSALSILDDTRKISRRDFSYAISKKLSGGTTVAGTMVAAHLAGIKVFATGGIGGVHRDTQWDVSADLPELSKTPMIVVCAGAKAILDLPATLEYLETLGVLVIGYQTNEFPAFYSRSSGIALDTRMDKPAEIAASAKAQWSLGLSGAILVTQPPPTEVELPFEQMDSIIKVAVTEAKKLGIHGPAVTPFLLEKVKNISNGESMVTNVALLKNNAKLAAQISVALNKGKRFLI